ncbi:hypothetical protein [Streptomyces sp. NPDC047841]|uniref:hypothetical protein n=1 Tax=Streptomyces sp. NPDC047841 TaxID=3154708 RepID=UPI00345254D1
MPRLPWRRRGWTTLCAVFAVLAASPAPAFPAAEPPVPPPAAATAPAAVPPGAPRVTLVTGDTVAVVRAPTAR